MNHRFIDLTGKRFGTLSVVALNPARRRGGTTRWDCQCDCGRLVTVGIGDLKVAKSCGCKRTGRRIDLSGVRFGRLVAITIAPRRLSAWHCRCDCGGERVVLTVNLRCGRTVSCGCYNNQKRVRHGLTGTKEIARWYQAQRRARIVAAGGSHTVDDVRRLWKAQRGRCSYCKADLTKVGAELDHIVALSRGGDNSKSNLQWLCKACNRSKHARSPEEFARTRQVA